MTTQAAPAWATGVAERVGPIVVKEVRQGLRAKTFAIFFSLLLIASVIAAVVAWSDARLRYATSTGEDFLATYLVGLSLVCFFVIPFVAFRAMVREREDETWVLLVLTGLGARSIVRGKWVSAMSQAMLFGSVCAPFVTFSYFLNGIDLVQVVLGLAMTGVWTCFVVAVAVGVATQAATRLGRTIAHFVTLGLLSAATAAGIGFCVLLAQEGTRVIHEDGFLPFCGGLALVCLVGTVVVLEGAAAGLSLPSEAASRGPRVALTGLVLAMLAYGALGFAVADPPRAVAAVGSICTSLVLLLGGVFGIGEEDGWPRACGRMGLLKPGALRSFNLILLLLGLCTAVWLVLYGMGTDTDGSMRERNTLLAAPMYVALYLSAAAFFSRVTPIYQAGAEIASRVAFIVVTALGIIVPPLLAVMGDERANHKMLNHLNPLIGLINFVERNSRDQAGIGLTLLGAATLLFGFLAAVALKGKDEERHA